MNNVIKASVFVLLLLPSCKDERTPAERAMEEKLQAEEDFHKCEPTLVTQSSDGVNLWRVSARCRQITGRDDVYFSSRGTVTTNEECHLTGRVNHCENIKTEVPNSP